MAYIGRNSFSSLNNSMYNLIGSSSVSKNMLNKAYSNLSKTHSVNEAAKKAAEEIMNSWKNGDSSSSNSDASSVADLKKLAGGLRSSSMELLDASRMDDDKFIEGVKKFTENYNSTLKNIQKSDSYIAVKSGIDMVNTTTRNAIALKRSGITVNEDNTLTVDEKVMKRNMASAKRLFDGDYSYGAKMAKKGSDLQTVSMLSANNASGLYNKFGLFY